MRVCLYCGEPLPAGCSSRRVYCCIEHRRQYQNERRRDERAEAAELRQADTSPMSDPWSRCDLDEWSVEEIYANALLDPAPISEEADALAGPLVTARPGKAEKGWKKNWLWLW